MHCSVHEHISTVRIIHLIFPAVLSPHALDIILYNTPKHIDIQVTHIGMQVTHIGMQVYRSAFSIVLLFNNISTYRGNRY